MQFLDKIHTVFTATLSEHFQKTYVKDESTPAGQQTYQPTPNTQLLHVYTSTLFELRIPTPSPHDLPLY